MSDSVDPLVPPSSTVTQNPLAAPPIPPLLTPTQRTALLQMLADLLSRRLLRPTAKEVDHEPR
jgi:hypothetical protein